MTRGFIHDERAGSPPGAVRPAAARAADELAADSRASGQAACGRRRSAGHLDAGDRPVRPAAGRALAVDRRRPARGGRPPRPAGVALVATGGYGRREMAPYSDLDLMLLHDGHAGSEVADLAARLVQDLFDAGLQVGQSVRTAAEACGWQPRDATILSSLLDARGVIGPSAAGRATGGPPAAIGPPSAAPVRRAADRGTPGGGRPLSARPSRSSSPT